MKKKYYKYNQDFEHLNGEYLSYTDIFTIQEDKTYINYIIWDSLDYTRIGETLFLDYGYNDFCQRVHDYYNYINFVCSESFLISYSMSQIYESSKYI